MKRGDYNVMLGLVFMFTGACLLTERAIDSVKAERYWRSVVVRWAARVDEAEAKLAAAENAGIDAAEAGE